MGRDYGTGDKHVRPYLRAGLEGVTGGDTAVALSGYRFNGANVGNTWVAGTGVDARLGKSMTVSVDGGYRGRLGAAGAEGVEGKVTLKKAFWFDAEAAGWKQRTHAQKRTKQKAGSREPAFCYLPRSEREDQTSAPAFGSFGSSSSFLSFTRSSRLTPSHIAMAAATNTDE